MKTTIKRTNTIDNHGTYYLLSGSNTKIAKSNGHLADEYSVFVVNAGLSLAPHTQSNHNVCKWATPGCIAACVLWYSGRTVMQSIREAMKRRTQLLFDNPSLFYRLLDSDIDKLVERSQKNDTTPYVRLNVASDLDWRVIARNHPGVQFYDYTKCVSRMRVENQVSNYPYTYSVNERSDWRTVRGMLQRGHNVACVFSTLHNPAHGKLGTLPATYRGFNVVNGDMHDVRHPDFDGSGNIIALRFKGGTRQRRLAIKSGFCIDVGSGWDISRNCPIAPYNA